jgi:hypothetical protein
MKTRHSACPLCGRPFPQLTQKYNPHGIYCENCKNKSCTNCPRAELRAYTLTGILRHSDETAEPFTINYIEATSPKNAIDYLQERAQGKLEYISIKQILRKELL